MAKRLRQVPFAMSFVTFVDVMVGFEAFHDALIEKKYHKSLRI